MAGHLLVGVSALACLLPLVGAANALTRPVGAAAAAPTSRQAPDSAELHSRAKDAQRRFEFLRVDHLPIATDAAATRCDDRVGRMCWRHDTGGWWRPDPEDVAVRDGRSALIDTLARIGEAIPGDEWVLGQRVHYLLEAGRTERALTVARGGCQRQGGWWCDALQGLALHVLGDYPAALDHFERAVDRMSPEVARKWVDVETLLDGDAAGALERARRDGAEAAVLATLWTLADPLYVVPGNDRLTEHHARRTMIRIRTDAWNPHGIPWGDDLAELLLRYGWAVGWERVVSPPGASTGRAGAVGHEHPSARSFLPPGRFLREPLDPALARWSPGLAYARSAYAPLYAPIFLPAPATLVVLPRPDGARVLAATEFPRDTTYRTRHDRRLPHRPPARLAGAAPLRGLVVRGYGGDRAVESSAPLDERGALSVRVPSGHWIVSVEVWDADRGMAGRHREVLAVRPIVPDVASLSDLLLLDGAADAEPESVDAALPHLLPPGRLESPGSVRVAWEVGGLGHRSETLEYRLSLQREEGGALRRLGEFLGLVGAPPPVVLEWTEPAPAAPAIELRSIALSIPEVEPGRYRIRLELNTPGRSGAIAERWIELRRRGDRR